MTKITLLLGLCVALVASGCSMTNLADIIQAAGTDPATVCARVTSVYGTLTFLRSNITQGDVSCDTLTVKSTPAGVTVPIAVTPQFRLEQPTMTPTR